MKATCSLILLMFLLWSCSDETLTPTTPVNEMTDMDAMQAQSGEFMNGPYGTVTGTAQLFINPDGSVDIKLANFNTSNGPDLYVYLSKEAMPINFISVGKLKSTNGNQVYSVPSMPDLNEFTYVCIHCKEYNHLFGYALIK